MPKLGAQLASFNFLKSTDLGGWVKLCAYGNWVRGAKFNDCLMKPTGLFQ